MSSFAKLVAVFSASLLAVGFGAEKPKGEKTRKPAAAETGAKKNKNGKHPKPEEDGPPKAIDVPVAKGYPSKGLKIPYNDGEGKLQMIFTIGVATKIDDTHVQMSQLQIETFDDAGASEMVMDFPTSVLDLTTSVITAEQAVTIKRADFELTGNTMTFNTKTKQGGLGGKVRMLIYNLENETAPPPATPAPQTK